MTKWPKHLFVFSIYLLLAGGVLFLLLASTGCGPPPAVREFLEKVERTKQKYKSSEIKQAALPLINQTNDNVPIPKIISSLPIFEQEGEDKVGDLWRTRDGIGFITGSGFGHWGIVVCTSKKSEEEARKWKGTLYPWENGVYFWIER